MPDTKSKTILVIEARYYDEIADNMVVGATPVIEDAGLSIERMSVPGTFEIPAACEMAIRAGLSDPHQNTQVFWPSAVSFGARPITTTIFAARPVERSWT